MIETKKDFDNRLSYQEFSKVLSDFMRDARISVSELQRICNEKLLSRSSCHRIKNAQIDDKYYLKILPILETSLENWMISKNWSSAAINERLDVLFPHRKDTNMIINRCELTANAIKFFNLKADPFDVDLVPSSDGMFTDAKLDDIAARVKDAVLYKRLLSVVGDVGTGKTSMKIRIARELSDWSKKNKENVHLIYPEFFDMNAVTVGAIAATILEEFGIKVPSSSTKRVRRIKEHLTSLEKDGARVALVFDECHRLNDQVITSLKNFWEMTNGGYARLLGIILFGQPLFVESTLRQTKFTEIAERVQIVKMPSMEKSAYDYLQHKISSVGGDIEKLFSPQAVKRICSVAKTPLSLGNLANAALMEAFKLEEPQVAAQMLSLPDEPRIRSIRAA